MVVAAVLFWVSLAALLWTQALYSLFAAAVARLRPRPVRKGDVTPTVAVIVAAHDERAVIERRVENLLALDYPPELRRDRRRLRRLDRPDRRAGRRASPPATRACASCPCPRAGKVAAQNRAVRATTAEVIAFSDANARWEPDALR